MIRRYALSPTKTPARTGGEDRPAPACADQPDAFDVLIDSAAGPGYRAAQAAARNLCGFDVIDGELVPRPAADACPFRDTCLWENRDETWVKAILTTRQRVAA